MATFVRIQATRKTGLTWPLDVHWLYWPLGASTRRSRQETLCGIKTVCMGAYWESLAFPIGQEAYGEPRGHALERQRATSPFVEVFGS